MNFGNYEYNYEYDYNIPEELLMSPENAVPPPIIRQRAFNNLYNINDNYEFEEVNVEGPIYRTMEINVDVPITSTKSEEYIKSNNDSFDHDNNFDHDLPKAKRIKTI